VSEVEGERELLELEGERELLELEGVRSERM
jgi:hypothetical protein